MGMGLCPTRASRAWEPRYNGSETKTPVEKAHLWTLNFFLFFIRLYFTVSVLAQQHKSVMQIRDIPLD